MSEVEKEVWRMFLDGHLPMVREKLQKAYDSIYRKEPFEIFAHRRLMAIVRLARLPPKVQEDIILRSLERLERRSWR